MQESLGFIYPEFETPTSADLCFCLSTMEVNEILFVMLKPFFSFQKWCPNCFCWVFQMSLFDALSTTVKVAFTYTVYCGIGRWLGRKHLLLKGIYLIETKQFYIAPSMLSLYYTMSLCPFMSYIFAKEIVIQ